MALAADTHRVEAVNAVDAAARRSEDRGDAAAPAHTRDSFDFRLTRSVDAPTAAGTVLELFASYLVAASHSLVDPLTGRVDVVRVVVDGTVPTDADAAPGFRTAVASMSATLHVETPADDAALEDWRRTLRDAEPTQEAVPTDVTVSLAVVRTSRVSGDTR
ncbi:hypothetical protein C2R22_11535 [Salinigranum rubrum]|uniref:Uncharacterized protein n=1 Tax=Salinigranum rubrum TaxID=755307 RepID=A0A2I8VJW0_9EURY|nr:hypothetical protein [Salinigranum rubrum]AUV82201.1 hypothetical protein C2R22_11535 [Salinigranum rubrum]